MKSLMFLPKSEFALRMEERYPNASFGFVTNLIGIKAEPFSFRCPYCHTRPGYFRRGVWLVCGCPCATVTTQKDTWWTWPHTAEHWREIIDVIKAAKVLHLETSEQNPAAN